MNKKESRQFNISVEGINCEMMYFNHLKELINISDRSTYHLKIDIKKMTPLAYAKRNAHKPVEKRRNNQKIPFIHIQDIEDYYDDYQKAKFFGIIDEMRKAEEIFSISYELGYSNYTFELWMLLHVADMNYDVQDRRAYLDPINRWFHRHFANLDEFKRENEFQKILDEYVTIDSVKCAIQRAGKIVDSNISEGKIKETYKGFTFFRDNPDVTIHEIVRMIFDVCEVE